MQIPTEQPSYNSFDISKIAQKYFNSCPKLVTFDIRLYTFLQQFSHSYNRPNSKVSSSFVLTLQFNLKCNNNSIFYEVRTFDCLQFNVFATFNFIYVLLRTLINIFYRLVEVLIITQILLYPNQNRQLVKMISSTSIIILIITIIINSVKIIQKIPIVVIMKVQFHVLLVVFILIVIHLTLLVYMQLDSMHQIIFFQG